MAKKKKLTALDLPVLVLDVETRKSSLDVGGWKNKANMGISVAVTYDSASCLFTTWSEDSVGALVKELYYAKAVVGHNLIDFDYHVIQGALKRASGVPIEIAHLRNMPVAEWPQEIHTIDLMQFIKQDCGHKVSLDALAHGTLAKQKSGHGLQAVELWKESKLTELNDYCKQDVYLTWELYKWGITKGTYWWITKQNKPKWGTALWRKYAESLANRL